MNLDEKIELLQYQISILSECVDYDNYPVQKLILSLNWNDKQLNKAHDIFQKYDELLEKKSDIKWIELENDLKSEFSIGYQTVKQIVIAFYKNSQWVEVCTQFAMSFEPYTPVEFHQITRHGK